MTGFVASTARAAKWLKEGKQNINKALGHKEGKGGKKGIGPNLKPPTSTKEAQERAE